jgi:hypothetical protein
VVRVCVPFFLFLWGVLTAIQKLAHLLHRELSDCVAMSNPPDMKLSDDDTALISCDEDRSQIPTGDAFIMICNMFIEADIIDNLAKDRFETHSARVMAHADAKQIQDSYPQIMVCVIVRSRCDHSFDVHLPAAPARPPSSRMGSLCATRHHTQRVSARRHCHPILEHASAAKVAFVQNTDRESWTNKLIVIHASCFASL